MKIIGLNSGEFNSSAAGLVDGCVVGAAPEERFTRQKKTKAFPANALRYTLDTIGCDLNEVAGLAQAWNPGAKWCAFNPLLSVNRIKREDYFYTIPDNLFTFAGRDNLSEFVKLEAGGGLPPIWFIQHHRCHAANAFYLSSFESAAFITCDWQGEQETLTRGWAADNTLNILDKQLMPNSLGMFYATYTQLLGYSPNNDEWKVMAMSASEVDAADFEEAIMSTVELQSHGRFILDGEFYLGSLLDRACLYSDKLLELLEVFTSLRDKNSDFDWQCRVAKAMQTVAEKIMWHVLNDLYSRTNSKNLVLSGGFFMNSVLNGRITSNTPFEKVYISHSPDDLGNSIGAALYLHHVILDQPRHPNQNASSYLGPNFTPDQIIEALNRRKIQYTICDSPEATVAKLLSEGHVVGLFQGRMEFGDRALGNRSILADPRDFETKNRINSAIKYREGYRPFAPACLEDHITTYFDVLLDYECKYMEKVVRFRDGRGKDVPAVSHFDNSARVQTVSRETNNYFYKVLDNFYNITGIPMVVNTSFNINGEPIVMSPDDAISTFFNSGLEFLMLENILVTK